METSPVKYKTGNSKSSRVTEQKNRQHFKVDFTEAIIRRHCVLLTEECHVALTLIVKAERVIGSKRICSSREPEIHRLSGGTQVLVEWWGWGSGVGKKRLLREKCPGVQEGGGWREVSKADFITFPGP